MSYIPANLASSTLSGGISDTATTINIQSADGSKFPTINQGGVGSDYSLGVFFNAAGDREFVKVIRHDAATSSLTIIREFEDTTRYPKKSWLDGSGFALRFTASAYNSMVTPITVEVLNTATSSFQVPAGTTAQQPTGADGKIRYNTDLNRYVGYDSTKGMWDRLGGGATGSGTDSVFYENDQTVTTSYTLTTGKNASTTGPLTIADGQTLTVPDGARLVIL